MPTVVDGVSCGLYHLMSSRAQILEVISAAREPLSVDVVFQVVGLFGEPLMVKVCVYLFV